MNIQQRTALLSVLSNTLLVAMKFVVGSISGSVSIVSEAIHSSLDLLAACIAFFSVRISHRPPDADHPYGHGKVENVSGVIEALLIFVASVWIIYEAVEKIIHPAPGEHLWLGIVVMAVSALVNWGVSTVLYRVARQTDSIALEADALHLRADVWTSLGVAGGLALIYCTGYTLLDPLVAICVALFILRESWELLHRAFAPLMDTSLSADELQEIESVITACLGGRSFHDLRARKSGSARHIDFHMDVQPDWSVQQAHDLCDTVESCIIQSFPHSEVTIHIEPPHK